MYKYFVKVSPSQEAEIAITIQASEVGQSLSRTWRLKYFISEENQYVELL